MCSRLYVYATVSVGRSVYWLVTHILFSRVWVIFVSLPLPNSMRVSGLVPMRRSLLNNSIRNTLFTGLTCCCCDGWSIMPIPEEASMDLSFLISSWYSLRRASFGSSLIFGLFLMFFARLAYLKGGNGFSTSVGETRTSTD